MKHENLWGTFEKIDDNNLTDNIKIILGEQADYLRENTNGRVLGKFRRIRRVNSFEEFKNIKNEISGPIIQEIEDDDTKGLKNADSLYENNQYCFEIYNETYKYRPFEMIMKPIYPVKIIIDEDVWDDEEMEFKTISPLMIKKNREVEADSESVFMEVIKVIFTSKKVGYIIDRLQKL